MALTSASLARSHESTQGFHHSTTLLVPSKQALRRPSLSTEASACSLGREESHESMSNLPSKNNHDTDCSSYSGSPRYHETLPCPLEQTQHQPLGRNKISHRENYTMPPPGLSMPRSADMKNQYHQPCDGNCARRAATVQQPSTVAPSSGAVSGLRDKLRQKGDNVMASLGTQETRELPAWLMPAKPKAPCEANSSRNMTAPSKFQRISHAMTNDCATRAPVTASGSRRKNGEAIGTRASQYMVQPHGAPRGEEPAFIDTCAARGGTSWIVGAPQPGQRDTPEYVPQMSSGNRSSWTHSSPRSSNHPEVSVPVVFHF